MKNLSIFRVEKRKQWTKIYFQSIEEMYELYIHLRKKNPKLEIDVLKETRDKRVSSIEGKYYNELPEKIKIGKYNYFRIKNKTKHKDIGLRTYGIKRYIEDYYYIPRKEFDKRRDGQYSFISLDQCLCLNSETLEQQFYELRQRTWCCGSRDFYNYISACYNSEEELYHVYLYFLRKGYHIKITTDIETLKWPNQFLKAERVSRVYWDKINDCYNQRIYATTLNLNDNYKYFLKFIEDLKNLYYQSGYTFDLTNYPCTFGVNVRSRYSRFQRYKILIEQNKLIDYYYGQTI